MMMRLGLLCALSLTLTMEASGQSKGPWLFNGGFTAGVTAAQVRGDGIDGFNKLGFHAGAVLDIRQFQDLGFQMGMIFNQKGSRKVQNINAGDFTTWAYRFTYVDVPLTLVYDFKDQLTVGGGIQPGVLISGLEDGVVSGVSDGAWVDTELPIRAWELSGVIWVGMRTSEQGEWFIRHTQSLPGIVPKPDLVNPNTTWDDRMQNITMQIGYTRLFRPWSAL